MNIDWSEAPADATHARKHLDGLDFYKRNEQGKWVYWDARGKWSWAYGTSEEDCQGRPAPWSGEGLPPVGIACEVKNDVTYGWDSVDEVLVHTTVKGEMAAVFKRGESILYALAESFRPIQTAEQIAAAERKKAIEQMIADTNILTGIMSDRRIMAGQLYDAGYRKQVNP